MFYFEEINNYKVLKSNLLKEVNHCFTTRGISINKLENCITDLFKNSIKPEIKNKTFTTISPEQTHSANIEIVDNRLKYPNTDGLIISQKNIAIALKFADCTPLILYDTTNNIGAISHAGWRGTAQKIGPKTVEKMHACFGTKPQDIVAIVGPAIGVCCYEVSDEVKTKLLETVSNTSGLAKGNNVDLKQINARQFEEIGVTQIDICPFCTSCNNDLFYSYRKENGTPKRHYAILEIN